MKFVKFAYQKKIIFSMAMFIIILILTSYNKQTATRFLGPHDIETALLLDKYGPHNLLENSSFKLVISPDIAVYEKRLNFSEIVEIEKEGFIEDNKKLFEKYPYRYPNSLSIDVGTYQRKNICYVRMILDKRIESDKLSCAELKDNSLAAFTFKHPLSAGIYDVHFKLDNADKSNVIAIYAYTSKKNDELWLRPYSQYKNIDFLSEYKIFFQQTPSLAIGYLICITAVVIMLLMYKGKRSTIIYMALILYAGNIFITKLYSGHDETAHVHMFHKAFKFENSLEKKFFRNAKSSMYKNDFFRLHLVEPQPDGVCPHYILQTCGITNNPMLLYQYYIKLLKHVHEFTGTSPEELLWAGRLISSLWLIIFLVLVRLILGKDIVMAVSLFLIFAGSYQSQFASITNDMPMYILGFWGMATLAHLLANGRSLRGIIAYSILVVGWCIGSFIDRSYIAGLITVVYYPFVFILIGKLKKDLRTNIGIKDMYKSVFCGLLYAALLLIGVYLTKILFTYSLGKDLVNYLLTWIGDAGFLLYPIKLDFYPNLVLGYWYYFKSFFGTYVWGHSYYNRYIYCIYIICLFSLIYFGSLFVSKYTDKKRAIILLLTSFLTMVSYFYIVIAVAGKGYFQPEIVFGSYLKVRLTAPGISTLMALPILGIIYLQKSRRFHIYSNIISGIWILALLLYYYPRFYIGDVF